jgi:hypothetical protein
MNLRIKELCLQNFSIFDLISVFRFRKFSKTFKIFYNNSEVIRICDHNF